MDLLNLVITVQNLGHATLPLCASASSGAKWGGPYLHRRDVMGIKQMDAQLQKVLRTAPGAKGVWPGSSLCLLTLIPLLMDYNDEFLDGIKCQPGI